MRNFLLVGLFVSALVLSVSQIAVAEVILQPTSQPSVVSQPSAPVAVAASQTQTSVVATPVLPVAPVLPVLPVTNSTPAIITQTPEMLGKSESPNIQNNIQILPAQPTTMTASNANTMESSMKSSDTTLRVGLTPMAGVSDYFGRWGNHIGNAGSFGLLMEFQMTDYLSLEAEGIYGRYSISYGSPGQGPFSHPFSHWFNQYSVGGGLKAYLSRGMFRPYVGGGVQGLFYENMSYGPSSPHSSYDRWIGAVQLTTGLDINVNEHLAIGPRLVAVVPAFNRPATSDNGVFSYPQYEEAAAMNTALYRALVSVRIGL